jgi:hypothetical protein
VGNDRRIEKTSVKGAAEGLRRPLQVERTGEIVPGLAAMPRRHLGQSKITRMSAEVIRLRRTAMRLVPAAGRLFEGAKQMRDGSNRDMNVGIGGCVSLQPIAPKRTAQAASRFACSAIGC